MFLLPLIFATVFPDDVEARLKQTLRHNPDVLSRMEQMSSDPNASPDGLFNILPGHRLEGAHLPHGSYFHWVYALLSAAVFGSVLAINSGRATGSIVRKIVLAGVITGTVGIVMLLAFQFIAEVTQGFYLTRGNWLILLVFYVVKFIGFSYRAATDPETGFFLSFVGFTCGVGLCEELCKAFPVYFFMRAAGNAKARAVVAVGLASGVGFGVSEGIMYAGEHYNGVSSLSIYLVRFLSCVALHAIWSGSAAVLMLSNPTYVTDEDPNLGTLVEFVTRYLLVTMLLHGLYDTLLKKDFHVFALLTAIGSYLWFAWLSYRKIEDD